MPDTTDVSAASSTATAQPQTLAPESWSDAQRSEWLKSGEQPKAEASAPSKPQDNSSAANAAELGSDSEPGQSNGEKRRTRSNANDRIRELASENKRLKDELAGRQPAKPIADNAAEPTSKPSTEQTSADTSGRPKKPVQENFPNYPAFEEALDKYYEDLADWRYDQRKAKEGEDQRKRQAEDQAKTVHSKFMERVEAAKKTHADFDAVIEAAEHVQASPAVAQFIMESEAGGDLSYYLAKNLERFEQINAMSPLAAARELTKIELELTGTSKTSQPAAEAAAATTPTTPKPKTTTTASKPPTELTGRATAPEDEAEAALKAGDFPRYQRIMNARDTKK